MKDQEENFLFEEDSNYMSQEEKDLIQGKEVVQPLYDEVLKQLNSAGRTDKINPEEISEMLQNPQLFVIKKIHEKMGDLKVPGTNISFNKDKLIEMIEKPAMEKLIDLSAKFLKISTFFKLEAYTVKDNIIEISPEVLKKIRESYSVKADTPEKKELLKTHQELLKNLNIFNELFHKITGEKAFFHTLGAGKLIPQMFLYNEKENTLELKSYYYKENSWRFKQQPKREN